MKPGNEEIKLDGKTLQIKDCFGTAYKKLTKGEALKLVYELMIEFKLK